MATVLEAHKGKVTGGKLTADEWNLTMVDIETAINAASGLGDLGLNISEASVLKKIANDTTFSGTDNKNYTISSEKDINFEPAYNSTESSTYSGYYGDILMKPGDDIGIYSHHRASDKLNEVSVKILNGVNDPVLLEVLTKGITLQNTYTQLTGLHNEEFNVNVNTGGTNGSNNKGYLKVRARAIDLRCEDHGGIALQPKGVDSDGKQNKIKFEHGGGDGKEFATFNTEKTSIFTDEYRFNKDGVVKMATRTTEVSDKKDIGDVTTYEKYVKASDDFYDNIDSDDETATWNSIIKTANALNDHKNRHTKITSNGNLEIQVEKSYYWLLVTTPEIEVANDHILSDVYGIDTTIYYNAKDFSDNNTTLYIVNDIYKIGELYYLFLELASPDININGGNDIQLTAEDDVILAASGVVKLLTPEVRMKDSDLIDIGASKNISFDSLKVSKKGKLEATGGTTITIVGGYNNMTKTVYYDPTNSKIYIILDKVYDAEGNEVIFSSTGWTTKAAVYTTSSHDTLVTASQALFLKEGDTIWYADVNKSSQLKEYGNKDHEILTGEEWANTVFVDSISDIPATATETIAPKPSSEAETTTIKVQDIVDLITWCKTNNFGPWAE